MRDVNQQQERTMTAYPVSLQLHHPQEITRWRPLVQWILALPHVFISHVLSNLSQLLAFVSWFIIMFTGQLPKGIADFQAMSIRYQARAHSYSGFLRESYPEFTFDVTQKDPGGDPLVVDIPAQLEDRDRVSVGLRIFLLIPFMVLSVLWGIVSLVVTLIGLVWILFTGQWPEPIRETSIKIQQWMARFSAYATLLRDDFPPLGLN